MSYMNCVTSLILALALSTVDLHIVMWCKFSFSFLLQEFSTNGYAKKSK